MKKLTNDELMDVNGGAIDYRILIFGGVVTFIIGLIDGITNPIKCR